MAYNKDEVKEALAPDDIYELLEQLGAEPEMFEDHIESLTICHRGHSRKLWYFFNTQLFKCWTHCQDTFDVFGLLQKVKDFTLNDAVYYVVSFFNLDAKLEQTDAIQLTDDWKLFKHYEELTSIKVNHDKIELPEISPNPLVHYPQPVVKDWVQEDIPKSVCDFANIHYDPVNGSVLIPHYDEQSRLIGIRERTLVEENKVFGKYKPWRRGKKMYNHPLAFNLYGLNWSAPQIKKMHVALVYESEKSVLQTINYLGLDGNLAVAVCGSSISKYQFELLRSLEMREMVICFDRDFESIGDDNYYRVVQKLQKIYDKYSPYVNVSFLFDKDGNKLGYKDSPTDKGREVFLELWKNRVVL